MSHQETAQESKLEKFFLAKVEDPKLRAVVGPLIQTNIAALVVTVILGMVQWYFGLYHTAIISISYGVISAIPYIFLRRGNTLVWRWGVMVCAWAAICLLTVTLGKDSFFWVWYLVLASENMFTFLESEKHHRRNSFIIMSIFLAITVVLMVSDIIPSEVDPKHRNWLVDFGIFTVIHAAVTLLVTVVRFQRETIAANKRLQAQSVAILQQAKMSTLGEMAGGVAHEINNPLAMILGHSTQLVRDLKDEAVSREKMLGKAEKIQTTVERISKIVSALRTFSRNADEDPFQKSKVSAILEDTLNLCSENLKTNQIDLRINGNQNFEFDCRPTQISQVLVNLLNNSLEAIRGLPEKWIEIKLENVSGKVRISVTDSGHGIPEAIADKVMQPFFTTKEIGKGTGLGLSISQGIVESHGGMISLDRTCSNTRFVLELPSTQAGTTAAAKTA